MDRIPEQALNWAEAGQPVALATVVETWGSAPRRAGAQLVVAGDGTMMGSVSGGCVEGAVVVEALEAIEDGRTRLLEYGVSDGDVGTRRRGRDGGGVDGRLRVQGHRRAHDLPQP